MLVDVYLGVWVSQWSGPGVWNGHLSPGRPSTAAKGFTEALPEVFRHESVNYWIHAAET